MVQSKTFQLESCMIPSSCWAPGGTQEHNGIEGKKKNKIKKNIFQSQVII